VEVVLLVIMVLVVMARVVSEQADKALQLILGQVVEVQAGLVG
jgi:hypothetical protein